MKPKTLSLIASISLLALIALCLAWEAILAPLRPGGSWMTLKVLPLMFALFGILRGRRYTHQWTSLLSLAYVAEGAVRAFSDQGASQILAMAEIFLATLLFAGCLGHARVTAPSRTLRSVD